MTGLRCLACKRPLKRPSPTGYGPDCARRRGITPKRIPKPRQLAAQVARSRGDEPVPHIPGQTELPMQLHQPTLWSL